MYTRKTYIYANRIERRLYHDYYRQSSGKRRQREKPSPEGIRENNRRESVRKLTRLIMNNFSFGDSHLVLTYRPEDRPEKIEARRILKNFMDRLRRFYKKQGAVLKWVMVTEWEKKNIHHHLILNDVPGLMKAVGSFWKGGKHFTPLYENYDYEGLAKYFVKETDGNFRDEESPYRQRYTHSRNLAPPVVHKERVRADTWRDDPGPTPKEAAAGYGLDKDSVVRGFDNAGFPFLEFILIKAVPPELSTMKKRRAKNPQSRIKRGTCGQSGGTADDSVCGYLDSVPGKAGKRQRQGRDRSVVHKGREAHPTGSRKRTEAGGDGTGDEEPHGPSCGAGGTEGCDPSGAGGLRPSEGPGIS